MVIVDLSLAQASPAAHPPSSYWNLMRIKSFLLSVSAFAVFGMGTAHANLILNGGFEQTSNGTNKQLTAGSSTTQTNFTTLTGWNSQSLTDGGGGYNFVMNPSQPAPNAVLSLYTTGNGFKASADGGNFFASDPAYGPGLLYQTVNGLVVGDLYTLTFSYALGQQSGYTGSNSDYWKFGLGTTLSDLNRQTSVLTIPQGGFSGWQTVSTTFNATSSTEMLGFLAATSTPGAPPFMLLDGVSLNAVAKAPAAAVPEPATWSLLLGGLGLVGVMARRRYNKRA